MKPGFSRKSWFGTIQFGKMLSLFAPLLFLSASCSRPPAKTETPAPEPSQIKVDVKAGGPIVLTTSSAEFQILPSGYIQASLIKGDQKLSLDQPGAGSSDVLMQDGKPVQFALDLSAAKVVDSPGKLGRGKRWKIRGHAQDANIQRTLQVEGYDAFPIFCFRARSTRTPAPPMSTSIA